MTRTTIDFGIDLGTTNSAIAVLQDVTSTIIKNNEDQDITPSAVYINAKGVVRVGDGAKSAAGDDTKEHDAYVEFKRRMGTEFVYEFRSSGMKKKPEDLSAEVLKELRANASAKFGEEILGAVVTVPAAFESHQTSATKKAAELAGFKFNALLTEPVAAALAYGFQTSDEKGGLWFVYDFGGGTFDAAIMKAHDGLINVVHHGGDNYLGGADIDWAILEKMVGPVLMKNYDLDDFVRGSQRWGSEVKKVKYAIEKAKIVLTTRETTTLPDVRFRDASGNVVECEEIELRRADLIAVAEPIINRSVDICLRVLKEKKLGFEEIQKVILVGGPTKAGYFRDILAARLKTELDFSVDPLTVVAQGAAVFASTQHLPSSMRRKALSGEFAVELKYSPTGSDTDPDVGGKVIGSESQSVNGFTIEFTNEKSKWRSGKIPLGEEGIFLTNLMAERGCRNTFLIELCDPIGVRQKTVPESLHYTVGIAADEEILFLSVGLGLVNNGYHLFGEKGAALPVKSKAIDFHTTVPIKPGVDDAGIVLPFVEGDNHVAADRNKRIGTYIIGPNMIKRELPAGSKVEVRVNIDKERIIEVKVYVPALDENFSTTIDLRKARLEHTVIANDYAGQIKRMKALAAKAEEAEVHTASAAIAALEGSEQLRELEVAIKEAKGDPDAAGKAENRLLEIKRALDEVEDEIEWPALVNDFKKRAENCKNLLQQHGSDEHHRRLSEVLSKGEDAMTELNTDRLKLLGKELQDIYSDVLFAIPAFWVNQFQLLEEKEAQMGDRSRARRLIEMGNKYLAENNVDGLRDIVRQLYRLLPSEEVEELQTFDPAKGNLDK